MGEIVKPIVWYTKDEFEMDNPICDFCSIPLEQFPCPVMGSYALCPQCQNRCHIMVGDTEYFESEALAFGLEPMMPGINMGGRKEVKHETE